MQVVVTMLVAVLTPIALVLSRKASRYLEERLQVTISDEQRKQLDWAALTAVAYIEEEARRRIKVGDVPLSPPVKLAMAKARARDLAPRASAAISESHLEDVLHAHVQRQRVSGAPPPLFPPGA